MSEPDVLPRHSWKRGPIATGLAAVVVLGTLAYAALANFSEPQLSPALEVIGLQAHDSGRYYVKFSFLATWFVTLALAGAGAALLWAHGRGAAALLRLARGRRFHDLTPLPEGPRWQTLHRRARVWRALIGLALLAPSAPFLAALLVDPARLYPLGYAAVLLSVFAPMVLIVGLVFLLDGLFLPQGHVGAIDDLHVRHTDQGHAIRHDIVSGGQHWAVPESVFEQLYPGMKVALHATRVSNTVLELRVEQPE